MTTRASTLAELTSALDNAAVPSGPSGLVLLEAVLPTVDLPDVLRAIARAVAVANDPAAR